MTGSWCPPLRGPGPAAVLEGGRARSTRGARPRGRRLRSRAVRPRRRCRSYAARGDWAGRLGAGQPAGLPRRATRGDRTPARRPHHRGRAVPGRARRLAGRRAHPVRCPGTRAVGARDRGPAPRTLRRGRASDARRRRPRAAAAGHRGRRDRAGGRRPGRARPRRRSADGHRRGRRVRAVRLPVPRVCGARAPAPPTRPQTPNAVVAATSTLGPAARCGQRASDVPDRARGDARVPAGRL